jgi:hypothetical protein
VRYTIPAVKISPSVMIWGAISARGTAELWIVPEKSTVNAAVYEQILSDRLLDSMANLNCTCFQQDGAPAHTSRRVKAWLDSHNVHLLQPWPGSSPDLNPIENCWATVKREVAKLKLSSRADLVSKIKAVWRDFITADYCSKLVESMPSRIVTILKAKGGPSKY